ncbi:heparinase II/III family protein [Paenibacillus sp. HJGM_3]|uniref:heparinase II/III family protein n=1 Tax=Paenibacillus sp. HJGM_3 TaxID=3379816 RepID=UPI00385B43E0
MMDHAPRLSAFRPMLLLLFAFVALLTVMLLPPQAARAYTDPSNMTDDVFFAKLNLDYPGLATVKADVAAANYTAAKTHLLSYFQSRSAPVYFPVGTTPSGGPLESSPDDLVNYIFTILGETKNFSGSGGIQWDQTWTGGSWSNSSFNNYLEDFLMYNILAPGYNALAPGDPKRTSYSDTWMKFALEFITDKGNTANGTSENILDLAKRLTNWNMAYSVFRNSPSIDAPGNAAYLKHIWQMADYAYANIESANGNNWYASIARAIYIAGVYFPEFKDAENWRMRGEGAMSKYMNKNVKGDGMNDEPTEGYHLYGLSLANTIQQFGQLNGYADVLKDSKELLERSAEFTMDALFPNLEEGPMIGDSSEKEFAPHGLLADYATIYGRSDFEYIASHRASGTVPDHTSVVYPNSSAIMRTGWNDNDKYMFIENEDTDYGASHNHPDDLSLVMYAYGKRLIADPGVYTYDSPDTVGDWLRRTTEAHNTVEVNNNPQSLVNRKLNKWITNAGFDFYDGQHGDYAPIYHNRKVFFAKPNYWIVSDVMTGSAIANTYEQLWHFRPNTLSLNGTTKAVTTQFVGEPNVKIVPADPTTVTAAVRNGYYSDAYASYSPAQYLAYTKSATGSTSYDTVIFPEDAGQNHNVTVSRLAMAGVSPYTATALTINLDSGNNGNVAAYYLSHETTHPTRSFGTYGYNGELAYIEKTSGGALSQIAIDEGSLLTDGATNLLSATGTVQNLAVKYSGTTLQLSSSEKLAYAVTIYAPGVTAVTFNGAGVGFTTAGSYITVAAAGASTASTVLTDSFDVAPLTNEFYDFESGSATGWRPLNGTWSVTAQGAGKVYRQTNNASVDAKTVTTSKWTDVLVEADVTTVSATTGTNGVHLLARYQDVLNTYMFRYYSLSGTTSLRIEKVFAGTTTVLATVPFTMATGTTYKLKGTISGNTLKLYVDGTLYLTATDSDITEGYVGLDAHRRDAYFDNVKVTEIIGDDWEIDRGPWIINNFELYTDSLSSANSEVRTREQNDLYAYSGQAKVKVAAWGATPASAGLVARSLGINDGYRFLLYNSGSGTKLRIEKVLSGLAAAATPTVLAEKAYTVATGTYYTLKAAVEGGVLKLYVNGTLELSAYDTTLPRGGFGFRATNAQARFDDALLERLQ